MSKFLVILRREYAQLVKKKSFMVMTLLTPIIMAGFMLVPALLSRKGADHTETIAVIDLSGHHVGERFFERMKEYKLNNGTIPAYELQSLNEISPSDTQVHEETYDKLVQQIRDRRLGYLLIIKPEAYLADSSLLLVTNSDNIRTLNRIEYRLGQTLTERRLEVSQINIPVDSVMALTRSIDLPRQDTKGETVRTEFKLITGMLMMLLIYMLILIDGQSLMQSVIDEKSDRVMEVLVSSATPFQLMAGKILGTGLAALTQVGIWILGGAAIAIFSSATGTPLDSSITRTIFNPATVVSFVCFLMFGYLMYSTVFAFIGSVVSSPKEAQPLLLPIILVLLAPGMLISFAVLEFPDAGWIKVVSFIPTYTPLIMMMRVAVVAPTVEGNPLLSPIMGEAVIGMILILLATALAIWITARVFRVGILMYGKRPTFPEIVKWIRHP
jgi:ABC-2 type transport system permease protein